MLIGDGYAWTRHQQETYTSVITSSPPTTIVTQPCSSDALMFLNVSTILFLLLLFEYIKRALPTPLKDKWEGGGGRLAFEKRRDFAKKEARPISDFKIH